MERGQTLYVYLQLTAAPLSAAGNSATRMVSTAYDPKLLYVTFKEPLSRARTTFIMTASLVPTGTGTANVLMVNNGFLGLSTKADWYDTAETDDINPPVMCFVIQKDGKNYLWVCRR